MAATPPSPGPATSAGVAPGRLLGGRYRLDNVLASGGMAQVWQATDEVLRRQVAVKLLHGHLVADETFVARFRREAVAAARLVHPSIVAIYDTCSEPAAPGTHNGIEAIVMELVRGPTLRDRLDEGPMDPWHAAGIAAQVADALEVAHRSGLVHRDIKPANILLCDDGRVKVADFGIAKAAESGGAGADLTSDGLMVGTAKYLAPEQVQGEPVDARTDLYSLGIVLYEMLTGRPPFQADTDAATALARLTTQPMKLRQIRAGVPRSLETIVMRAISRAPADRYPTAAELRAALLAASDGGNSIDDDLTMATAPPATSGPPPRFAQSERAWMVPTLLVVLVAVSLGTVGLLFTDSGAGDILDDVFGGGDGGEVVALDVAEVQAFDPFGGDGEHNQLAGLAVDGDGESVWDTETYSQRALPPLKPGVGIWVTVANPATLDRLEVDSPTPGWKAEVYVGGQPGGNLAAWGEPISTVTAGEAGTTAIDLKGARGAAVLLWITYVGDAPEHSTEIGELRVFG